MEDRRLGVNGPHISVLGMGSWVLGGAYEFGWGPTDDSESVSTIRYAIDSGVNWVDTAAVYGRGHSEEVVGRAISPFNVGDDVHVFTKCGRNFYGNGQIEYDLRPESIRFECEQSLRRLGVERIDLFQFHWPDPATGTTIEDSWGTMSELVDEGKVRWIGVSNFDIDLLERCEPIRHVDSLQPPLSLINRAALDELIPWARANGTGVIVYSPMASGLLTGSFNRGRMDRLAEDDWRRRSPEFQEPRFARNLELVTRLRPIAAGSGVPLAALAVGWTLSKPGVTGAIVGARRPGQVNEWLPAATLRLDPETLSSIEDVVAEVFSDAEDAPLAGSAMYVSPGR
jgi:aryl-alcohol dehydrogenase-like predicted oxidoreductase